MGAFFAGLVTFMKGVTALKQMGEFFVAEWVKFDIKQIGNEADTKKEINEVLNLKLEQSTSDRERRALLLAMHGNSQLP